MKITQSRIRTLTPYLYEFSQGEPLRIALEVNEEHIPLLIEYGFAPNEELQTRIPRPLKRATKFNADGGWQTHRDQPKEPRIFEREYHVVDWHGNDHYGTCYQERMCYPRTPILPELIELTWTNGLLISPSFVNEEDNFDRIKLTINMFLEMFGECETRAEDLTYKFARVTTRSLPWRLLPPGQYPWERGRLLLKPIIEAAPKRQQGIISSRHEAIWNLKPQLVATGDEGFWGYIVYGFPELSLYVFESNRLDNATYVFRGNWEVASRLTKAEILSGGIHEARLIHTEHWRHNLVRLVRKTKES